MQKGEEKRGNTDKPERILVPDSSASNQKKCNRSDRTGKDEMENRKWGVQYAEKTWIRPGASVQQELPGVEKPLLPASDRAYDKPVYGGVGKDMEESEAEFGAETPETIGIHEGNAAGRA